MKGDEISTDELLVLMNREFSNSKLCKMSDEQKKEYKNLFDTFVNTNSSSDFGTKEKGDSLEELVTFLIASMDKLFTVEQNIKTSTNEIDQVVSLTTTGKMLAEKGVLNKNYKFFLCECKNYNKSVGVTFVGKFCSLLLTCQTKLGILFSYRGVTGKNWNAANGLIKKFYLSKEKLEEKYCVVDFNVDDFEAIYNGENFLDIVENKIKALQIDTDYSKLLTKHEAEGRLKKIN